MTSLIPPLQAVVALFRGPLQNVRFADIDAGGLTSLAQEVESAAAELQAQEAKLSELRQQLSQKQEALLGLAQQALAYARIYAEGDEALSAELNAIVLPRGAKPRKAGSSKAAPTPDAERSAAARREAVGQSSADAPAGPEPEALVAGSGEDDAAATKPARRKVQRRLGRPAAREDSV